MLNRGARVLSIGNFSKGSALGQASPFPMTPSGGEKVSLRGVPSGQKPMKTLPNRKPLYVEMVEREKMKEKEGLEEKKKRLEEIRSFH